MPGILTHIRAVFVCIPFLELEIQGAQQTGPNLWSAEYTGNLLDAITIQAFTVLGAGPVQWTVPHGVFNNLGNDTISISRGDPNNILALGGPQLTVTATANGLQEVITIAIRPRFAALNPMAVINNHYAFQTGGNWYAYDLTPLAVPGILVPANFTANVHAQIEPNTPAAWTYVQWYATDVISGNAVNLVQIGNERGIPLTAPGTLRVRASIAFTNQQRHIDITIRTPRRWADVANNLQVVLDRFTYAGGFAAIEETLANFNVAFGSNWIRNQPPPPHAFPANAAITLQNVSLNVTQAANLLTPITVRATAYLTHQNGNLTQLQGQAGGNINAAYLGPVVIGHINLGNAPNEVMVNDPLLIFWEINTGGPWTLIEVTHQTIYVTAAPPVNSVLNRLNNVATGHVYTYHSLLDMSCRAANGLAAGAPALRDAIYGVFQPANPNAQVTRRDGVQLDYWNTPAPAQLLNQASGGGLVPAFLLQNPANSHGACGAWAEMLMAMWAVHGIGTGRKIGLWASKPGLTGIGYPPFPMGFPNLPNIVATTRFLVRNWDYNNHGALANNNYTHNIIAMLPFGMGNEVVSVPGVSGQNNPNPPPQFVNHYIVRDGLAGNYYDPSYGTPPGNKNAWVDASVAGLRNDTTNTAGFVQNNPALPNQIQTNPDAVVFRDQDTGAWIP